MTDAIEIEQTRPKKMPVATSLDKEMIRQAYEDVRSNQSETEWVIFKFESSQIICDARGLGFDEFRSQFLDSERAFGYIRIQMGDEISKRSKFLFITWIGPEVGVMQRAKMSTDKSIIKEIISSFAAELQIESDGEMEISYFKDVLNRAGGANYGTGIRNN